MDISLQHYEAPRLVELGGFSDLTLASGNSGEDPCRFSNPRDVYKQTGLADFIQGQANLATCSA
jgi:hypothetical protein